MRLSRDGGPTDEPERPRLGHSHRLRISKRAFRDVISCRKRYDAHPGSLEASGLLLLLKWLIRTSKHHSFRIPLLVDAQAILGASAKGRTSATFFKRDLCRIAAVTLASNILPAYVYIPSEENPADAPSRGKWQLKHSNGLSRGGLKNLPVRKTIGKVSNQMFGHTRWRSTDDAVADFLGTCEGDEKPTFESLFKLFA